jgi:hypothetical protein
MAGGVARLEVALGGWMRLDTHAGVAAPFVRDTFYVLPNVDVYRPPPVVAWLGVRLGALFL